MSSPVSAGFVLPKRIVTVSPIGLTATGVVNGGADFGIDTSSSTSGIQEALNSVSSTGGIVYLLPGTFVLADYIDTNGISNLTIELHPGAVIEIPASAGWSLTSNSSASVTRIPGILVRNGSHIVVRGGLITAASGAGGTVTGIWIANTVDDAQVVGIQFINIPRFAVLVNGFVKISESSYSGQVTNVVVRGCEMSNCGLTSTTDGGGVRVENATTAPSLVQGIWVENNKIVSTNYFGVDVGGSPNIIYTVNGMYVRGNLITGVSGSGVGIKFEGQGPSTSASVVGGQISGNHIMTMGLIGIQISPPVTFVSIIGNLVESCHADGISVNAGISTLNGVMQEIAVSGNVCRNNNQGTVGAPGISITAPSANTTTISHLIVVGNVCTDDQSPTHTQKVGIKIVCDTNVTYSNVRVSNNVCPPIGSSPPASIGITVGGGTFVDVVVKDNPGYNPVGPWASSALTGSTVLSPSAGAGPTLTSGQVYQNISLSDLTVYIPATLNPAAGGSITISLAMGPAPIGLTSIVTDVYPAGSQTGVGKTYSLRVPPNYYFSWTVTLGTGATISAGNIAAIGE
jgi:hypothetical protein